MRILFTTGLRIAAVAGMRWDQVLSCGSGSCISRVVLVREKGNKRHAVVLTDEIREAIANWFQDPGRDREKDTVLGRSVRQLRNVFYRVCRHAGQRGQHCHPHTARHTVAHQLFAAGNPVALIAKYLGHQSLHTTNTVYLRLSFEEVMTRLRVPWWDRKTDATEGENKRDAPGTADLGSACGAGTPPPPPIDRES